jgi:hypothetical protein
MNYHRPHSLFSEHPKVPWLGEGPFSAGLEKKNPIRFFLQINLLISDV